MPIADNPRQMKVRVMPSKAIAIPMDVYEVLRMRKKRTGISISGQIAQLVEGVRYEQAREASA